MLRVAVSVSGKLKEPFWEAACKEYEKRLGAYCQFSLLQTADGTPPKTQEGWFTVAMCSEGEMLDSEDFARRLAQWQNNGVSRIQFLIGGSDGLPERQKVAADFRLSLSRMTWPHHMARAMLEEQIYRALNINSGGKYHK